MLLDYKVFSFFLSCLCLLFNFIFLHRRRFFLAACDVPSLEDKFNVDQYSDLVTVTKPVIYISIGEIINTHTVSPDHVMFAARWSCYVIWRFLSHMTNKLFFCPVSCCWTIRTPSHRSTTTQSTSCWRTWARFPPSSLSLVSGVEDLLYHCGRKNCQYKNINRNHTACYHLFLPLIGSWSPSGENPLPPDDPNKELMGKTEVSLTLANKFDVPGEANVEMDARTLLLK